MKKLLNGIIEFRNNVLEDYRESFARLALEQSPDSLLSPAQTAALFLICLHPQTQVTFLSCVTSVT